MDSLLQEELRKANLFFADLVRLLNFSIKVK